MFKYRLLLSFDGTNYHGWQIQPNAVTVQQVVEEALERFTGGKKVVKSAGRTDKGVHSLGMVVSFISSRKYSPETVFKALNFYLPDDVRVMGVAPVKINFDPKGLASAKEYRYVISYEVSRNPIVRDRVFFSHRKVEWDRVELASKMLLGENNFDAFSRRTPNKSPLRRIISLRIAYLESGVVVIRVVSKGFLRKMVRGIVGALLEVGYGTLSLEQFRDFLRRDNGDKVPFFAPPHALYLARVYYPKRWYKGVDKRYPLSSKWFFADNGREVIDTLVPLQCYLDP